MAPEKRNPAAPGSANRVPDIKSLRRLNVENPTETLAQSLAVRRTAQRFNITPTHARVVCELYGLGGAA